jgi:hypothetical protein
MPELSNRNYNKNKCKLVYNPLKMYGVDTRGGSSGGRRGKGKLYQGESTFVDDGGLELKS